MYLQWTVGCFLLNSVSSLKRNKIKGLREIIPCICALLGARSSDWVCHAASRLATQVFEVCGFRS
jgi:hypothetical protein